MDIQDVKQFVRSWNLKYPVDKWWRLRYSIPFNSPQHNSATLLDMRIEYEEFLLYTQVRDYAENEDDPKKQYSPGRGDWIDTSNKFIPTTQEQLNDISFEDLDLDELSNSGSITIPNK